MLRAFLALTTASVLASPMATARGVAETCAHVGRKQPGRRLVGGGAGNCAKIYEHDGWAIETCPDDPNFTPRMAVVLDGKLTGNAALVAISHRTDDGSGVPQVAVIAASGYVRLKQNADPRPSIPFGSSFVLGPAYWPDPPDPCPYHHSPDLRRLEIDTGGLPQGPLRMRAAGTNHGFQVHYEMLLPSPSDALTRLHVIQIYTALTDITIDRTRRDLREGFKLVQVSSMFINEGGTCVDGARVHRDCHDSNAARYVGSDSVEHRTDFRTLALPSFVFSTPRPLGSAWLDVLHTDNNGWQGNTPNVRIDLETLPADRTITPQAYVERTTNPADDNVGVWLSDDGPASEAWRAGQVGQISYWLEARDDPPLL
jgi:hypothetical protein